MYQQLSFLLRYNVPYSIINATAHCKCRFNILERKSFFRSFSTVTSSFFAALQNPGPRQSHVNKSLTTRSPPPPPRFGRNRAITRKTVSGFRLPRLGFSARHCAFGTGGGGGEMGWAAPHDVLSKRYLADIIQRFPRRAYIRIADRRR